MKKRSFEEAMQRLEEIVEILEQGSQTLDESLKLLEEGNELVNYCTEKLDEAEKKLKIVSKTENGFKIDEEEV